jgi:hypothetical protein
LLLLLAALGLSACVTTSIIDHWKDPAYNGPPLHKVLVVGVQNDPGRRRLWEDSMVAALLHQGVQASASWLEFPSKAPSPEELAATASRDGFDGVLASHFVRASQRVYGTFPGNPGPGWGWGWGWGWPYFGYRDPFLDSGYIDTEDRADYQTDVFTVDGNGGKLIWTGITRSVDLTATHSITDQISRVLVPTLTKERILAGK